MTASERPIVAASVRTFASETGAGVVEGDLRAALEVDAEVEPADAEGDDRDRDDGTGDRRTTAGACR